MKSILLPLVTALGLACASQAPAQENKTGTAEKPDSTPAPRTEKPKPTQEELEAKFKTTLTKATMSGRWCGIKDGKLGPEKEDKYTINSATKVGGDVWLITCLLYTSPSPR